MKQMDFEQGMEELEKIVRELEKEDIKLEENIKLYEKGVKIAKSCKDQLQKAMLKVEKLNTGEQENIEKSKAEPKQEVVGELPSAEPKDVQLEF